MGNSALLPQLLIFHALRLFRSIAPSPSRLCDRSVLGFTPTQDLTITNLGSKPTGPLRHQQTRHHMKYSGHITKTFTNKSGEAVTYKQKLDHKGAKKILLFILAVLGLVVCMWFLLCYEIGNLIETVFGSIGKGISILLSWIRWLGCEVPKPLSGW